MHELVAEKRRMRVIAWALAVTFGFIFGFAVAQQPVSHHLEAAQLLELPDGDFVDPTMVTDIQRFDAGYHGDDTEDRVIIMTSSNRIYVLTFGTDSDAAKGFARDFGKAVNAARSKSVNAVRSK